MPVYLLTIFFLHLSLLLTAQDLPTAEWKRFTDTAGKFTAKYPPAWKNKIKEGNRVFFTSPANSDKDSFFENVNVSVTQNAAYGSSVKIKDMFPAVTEEIKPAFRDFKSESQRFFKWNNMDACEIIYSGYNKIDESIKIRIIQWFCFYKTRLYTVTYTADAADTVYTGTAKKIMSSILFK